MLPTGKLVDVFDGIQVTCIDNGMPVVILPAQAFGLTGYESRDDLNANAALKMRLESIRGQAGRAMNLGDVSGNVVPKMTLVAPARHGGHLSTRTFIPHDCHSSIGVLGAVTVATAAVMPGSVAHAVSSVPEGAIKTLSVEHPTGEFSVRLATAPGSAASAPARRCCARAAADARRGDGSRIGLRGGSAR